MLTTSDILKAALRRWPAVLRGEATGESLFPLKIPFGRPRPSTDYAVLRREIESLASAPHPWRIDWESLQTRKWGRQRWPVRLAFDSIEDLATALGKAAELEAFRAALRETRAVCPALEPWVRTRGHRIVDHLADWSGLVAVCGYFAENPQPDCFARQIPLPVGTKFIEEHTAILRELLDVTQGERVNANAATFAERFHLRTEPAWVRFRFLDSELRALVDWPVTECAMPAPPFARLQWSIPRLLVVENRDVFLCLPDVPRTLAVFGAGKAASLLRPCRWIDAAEIYYWGDCDEAGFGILSSLRARFPHVHSLLMDDAAWTRWRHLALPGRRDSAGHHTHLTPSEATVLQAVVAGPWMLEQERIPSRDAERAIRAALT